LSNSNNDI